MNTIRQISGNMSALIIAGAIIVFLSVWAGLSLWQQQQAEADHRKYMVTTGAFACAIVPDKYESVRECEQRKFKEYQLRQQFLQQPQEVIQEAKDRQYIETGAFVCTIVPNKFESVWQCKHRKFEEYQLQQKLNMLTPTGAAFACAIAPNKHESVEECEHRKFEEYQLQQEMNR